jgi:prepilin-type N-terminal cleavage/methylation domain-containing protein
VGGRRGSTHPLARGKSLRRGFTLIEVLLAVVIAAMVLGALWMSLGQLTRTRNISRARLQAHLKADAALNEIRRDVASVLRSEDLFWTILRIRDSSMASAWGRLDRDDLLVFSSRLQVSRGFDFAGEGAEYETQYRADVDDAGAVLWQRRDQQADEYFDGGGVVTPLVEDIISLNVEAFDGEQWWSEWDSDQYGLPRAVSISVAAAITGHPAERPVILRTVVSIDRVLPPFDAFEEEDEEGESEAEAPEGNESE